MDFAEKAEKPNMIAPLTRQETSSYLDPSPFISIIPPSVCLLTPLFLDNTVSI